MEGQPKRLPEAATSFRNTPETGGLDALAKKNAFIDRVLIGQGEIPTEKDRQSLREIFEHISAHRS